MKREFTKEMVDKVLEANEQVKGTAVYGAYYVPFEAKTNGKWHLIGWGVANRAGIIKKGRNNTLYVYYTDGYGNEYRYELRHIFIDMFNLEVA